MLQIFNRSDYEACKTLNRKPLESTLQWLQDHPAYINWASTNSSSILQVSGARGSGKSVLARYVVDDGFQDAQCVRTYFFFKREHEKDQDKVSAALRAIFHQLLIAQPRLLDIISPEVTRKASVDVLSELLLQIIDSWNHGTILCVIDGLDECEEAEKAQILRIVQNIHDRMNMSAYSPLGVLKFLFTSRSPVLVECCVQRVIPTIVLSGEDEAAAINREFEWTICMELEKIALEFDLEEVVQSTLLERLLEVPQPTYAWVTTIFQDVRSALQSAGANLAILIDQLPQKPNDPYELLLHQTANREDAKVIAQYLLVAQRPLSVTELDVILALQPQSTSYKNLNLFRCFSREEYIRNTCGSFVNVGEGEVYFDHDAAMDFLLNITGSKTPAERIHENLKDLQVAHQMLARACVRLLLFEEFANDPLSLVCRCGLSKRTPSSMLRWANKNFILEWMTILFNEYSQLTSFSVHSKGKEVEERETDEVIQNKNAAEATAAVSAYRDKHEFLEFSSDSDIWKDVMQLYNPPRFGTWFSVYWATKPVTELPHFTTLTVAVALEQELLIPILLANGASIEEEDTFRQRALHWAACNGSCEMLDLLLQHGAEVDSQDGSMRTPLHLAVLKGKNGLRKAALLLHYGAKIDATDIYDQTPLHLVGNKAALSQLLIEHRANVEYQDLGGRTPLIMAAAVNAVDVARTLLQNGAELSSLAMYRAAFAGSLHVIKLFDEWREMLVKQRIAERSKTAAEAQPLLEAARYGSVNDLCHRLKQDHVPLDSCDLEVNGALHYAAERNNVDIIRFVLRVSQDHPESNAYEILDMSSRNSLKSSKRANLESATSVGRTPLFLAAQYGHIDTVKLLLDAGANVKCEECEGANALFFPVLESRMEMVKLLIDHGANVNSQEKEHGFTPLFTAILCNNIEMVRLLLENGADIEIRAHLQLPITAHAICYKAEEIVHLLFEWGADITAVDANHCSLLHWAVHSNSSEDLIIFLLENGVDIHAMDKLENTAVDYAVEEGSSQAVIDLLNRASQNQAMDPRKMLIVSMLKAVDAVQSRLLNGSNAQNITLTAEDVPEAMSTLLDTAKDLQKRKFNTASAKPSSIEVPLDEDMIWQTLLLLSQVLQPKGHENDPENGELIASVTHKLGLLLMGQDQERPNGDANTNTSRNEEATKQEEVEIEPNRSAESADMGAKHNTLEQGNANWHAISNTDLNINDDTGDADVSMGIMTNTIID
ncbi:ankyrin [Periconia macrospinosa]|uniref:Ankyrin n=1 Tax=Periconia macrospinosa TaxID=97972 RepID=A0A2V1DGF7_9PLEO|nr:ankyrin [Periconia macrospinosa]